MIKKIIQYFKKRKQEKELEKRYRERLEELKKRDPFVYKK